jgi:hypothetical protein
MENSQGQNLAGNRRAARDLLSMYPSFDMLPACAERRPSQKIAAIAPKVQASDDPETNDLAAGFRQISALDISANHGGRRGNILGVERDSAPRSSVGALHHGCFAAHIARRDIVLSAEHQPCGREVCVQPHRLFQHAMACLLRTVSSGMAAARRYNS